MADNINEYALSSALAPFVQAQIAMAMRPQKSLQETYTTSNTEPYALQDMIARRDSIGQATRELNDALKARETAGYSIANALMAMPELQGYGSWLGNAGRVFGAGLASPVNAAVDRAQKKYEAEMKDLADILAFDKAMGETTTQTQNQVIGYTPMEYGTAGGTKTASGQGGAQPEIPVLNPEYWDQMISNFDEGRKTEAAYRNMSQARRNIRNKTMIMGTPEENYARDQFVAAKGREFLPLARNALKGAGQITDFEDKKYTEWLNKVRDPVQLKDTAVRIVDDVALKNGWSKEQKAQGLEMLGLTSKAENLLPQQKQYEPERVKSTNINTEDILKKFGAKRVD
jgi:hypothetical protein